MENIKKINNQIKLNVVYVPIKSLRLPEYNPRYWSREVNEQLKESIKAAEKMKRKYYLMEKSNIYCEVIKKRWEKLTNLKAKKL